MTTSYLETELLTATPQKLRYLLICGAMRFARETVAGWERGDQEAAGEALIRCRRIIAELMGSIRPETSQTAQAVLGLYAFLFRHLTEAQLHRDAGRIHDVVRVLEEEGETWRLVCEQFPEAPTSQELAAQKPAEVTAGDRPAILGPDTGRSHIKFDSSSMSGPPLPKTSEANRSASGFQWNA